MVACLALLQGVGAGLVGLQGPRSTGGAFQEPRRRSLCGAGVALSAFGKGSRGYRREPDLQDVSQWSCPAAWRYADLPRTSLEDAVYLGS